LFKTMSDNIMSAGESLQLIIFQGKHSASLLHHSRSSNLGSDFLFQFYLLFLFSTSICISRRHVLFKL
jgi:hypothetical protein